MSHSVKMFAVRGFTPQQYIAIAMEVMHAGKSDMTISRMYVPSVDLLVRFIGDADAAGFGVFDAATENDDKPFPKHVVIALLSRAKVELATPLDPRAALDTAAFMKLLLQSPPSPTDATVVHAISTSRTEQMRSQFEARIKYGARFLVDATTALDRPLPQTWCSLLVDPALFASTMATEVHLIAE